MQVLQAYSEAERRQIANFLDNTGYRRLLDTYSPESLQSFRRDAIRMVHDPKFSDVLYYIRVNEKVAAVLVGTLKLDGEGDLYGVISFLISKMDRSGFGHLLIQRFEQDFGSRVASFLAWVKPGNEPSENLFQKMGYTPEMNSKMGKGWVKPSQSGPQTPRSS